VIRRTLIIAVLVLLAVSLAGCKQSNKVGDRGILDVKGASDRAALGQGTTTLLGPPTSAPAVSSGAIGATTVPKTTAAPVTTAKAVTTTTQRKAFEITINNDKTGDTQFVPNAARVYSGTIVRFKNVDSVPRSVVADNQAFNSGPIAPGGTWDYTAGTVGKFNFKDGTRPYAVGSLEVLAR
jgi:plastocyanin